MAVDVKTIGLSAVASLAVALITPWFLHHYNPAGPDISLMETGGQPSSGLSDDLTVRLSKSPNFTYALAMYGAGSSQSYDCLTAFVNDKGKTIDNLCMPIMRAWAKRAVSVQQQSLRNITDAPSANATSQAHALEVNQDILSLLMAIDQELSNEAASRSQNSDVSVYAVFLNDGDGDGVIYPDAELRTSAVTLKVTSGKYLTIKGHSFQQVKYALDPSTIVPNDFVNFKSELKNLPLTFTLKATVGSGTVKTVEHAGKVEGHSVLVF